MSARSHEHPLRAQSLRTVSQQESFTRRTGFTEAAGGGIGGSFFVTRQSGFLLEASYLNGSGDDFFSISTG